MNGANQLVFVDLVSDNYFRVLGVRAAVGRMLVESDARFEGTPPVVLTYSLWQRKFGGAADIVGKTIMLQFQPCHVVGVAPRDLLAPSQHLISNDAWAPMNAATLLGGRQGMTQRGKGIVDITLRLRHGVSRQQAETTLSAIAAQLNREYPATNRAKTVSLALRPIGGRP